MMTEQEIRAWMAKFDISERSPYQFRAIVFLLTELDSLRALTGTTDQLRSL